jgi:hypothetical protein
VHLPIDHTSVIVSRRQLQVSQNRSQTAGSNLAKVSVCQHTTNTGQQLVCGQSANHKVDYIIYMWHEFALNVMLLSKIRHDGHSIRIRRLQAEGLHVL